MIPEEVAIIAETLADHFNSEEPEGDFNPDEFIGLAYKIYNALPSRD